MPSRFLLAFAEAVVPGLIARGEVALADGGTVEAVVYFVAEYLGERGFGSQVVSSLAAALVACPAVEEVFADDEALKAAIDALPMTSLPKG